MYVFFGAYNDADTMEVMEFLHCSVREAPTSKCVIFYFLRQFSHKFRAHAFLCNINGRFG